MTTGTSPDWNDRYARHDTPWDTGRPSTQLRQWLTELAIAPCRVLEIGCGTGINAVYLAQQGFQVTAVDTAALAIEAARQRAQQAGVDVDFFVADLLVPLQQQPFWDGRPFILVFDRGVYHAVRRVDLKQFTRMLQAVAAPGALYLVLAGNANEAWEGEGPPRVEADTLCRELTCGFDLVALRECRFDVTQIGGQAARPLAWSAVLRRRPPGDSPDS
jgi:SAM-dependent methyltransferase